jgi:hypothetical protein
MEEIIAVLKDMPSDHALGPDGFNGAFFKKWWPILRMILSYATILLMVIWI